MKVIKISQNSSSLISIKTMGFLQHLHIIHSWTGLFHTVCAILAMVFGTMVLLNKKGTKKHKRLGYAYFTNMLLLNASAFGIYNFGTFSLFHGFALLSLFLVVMGILPAWSRKNDQWLVQHFYWMSWSVVGLYAAFWAELGFRFFDMKYFWWVVILTTIATTVVGAIIIKRETGKLFQ